MKMMIEDNDLEALIQDIFYRYQFDFRNYARSSLRRRLEQAMVRFSCKNFDDLRKRLDEEAFFPKLIGYLTVNTTEMFRDPSYFLAMKEKVLPYLKTYPSLKLWVAGCSTGEEVLSFAILLREAGIKRYLLYATDINPMNLEKAKNGIYDVEAIKKATQNYLLAGGETSLSNYYSAAYESVQFDTTLLANVVFSDHSLATDSVFSEVHLVSCRNVLIYFERNLQERVIKLFSDALVRNGYMGLGNKETIQFMEIHHNFNNIDLQNKIYQKRVAP